MTDSRELVISNREVQPREFVGCDAYDRVVLANVPKLNEETFYGSAITSVDLGDVEEVQQSVFRYCEKLSFVSFGAVHSIHSNAFSGTALTFVSSTKILYVDRGAFSACKNLMHVHLPNIKVLGPLAFSGSGVVSMELNVNAVVAHTSLRCPNLEVVMLVGTYDPVAARQEDYVCVDSNGPGKGYGNCVRTFGHSFQRIARFTKKYNDFLSGIPFDVLGENIKCIEIVE